MGMIGYQNRAWRLEPRLFLLITVVVLTMLTVAIIAASIGTIYEGMSFYYPGVFIGIVTLWLLVGIIHWMIKTSGDHSKVFRMRPEHCVRITENILINLGLEYERIEGEKMNPIFLWTIYYDVILRIQEEDISVSLLFNKINQNTTIYIGKVQPQNKELVRKIERGIDFGLKPMYLQDTRAIQIP